MKNAVTRTGDHFSYNDMSPYDSADYYAGGEDAHSMAFRLGSGSVVYDFRIVCRDDATGITTVDVRFF